MDEIKLPQHVVNRIDRRLDSKICSDAGRPEHRRRHRTEATTAVP